VTGVQTCALPISGKVTEGDLILIGPDPEGNFEEVSIGNLVLIFSLGFSLPILVYLL